MNFRISECRRFVVVEALHLDREVFEAFVRSVGDRQLAMQDAFQLALCTFGELLSRPADALESAPAPTPSGSG